MARPHFDSYKTLQIGSNCFHLYQVVLYTMQHECVNVCMRMYKYGLLVCMYVRIYVSSSTVILNGRDCHENVWFLINTHLEKDNLYKIKP